MSKDFFERLRRNAFKPYQEDEGYTTIERAGILGVVDATIEALKEMMVGTTIKARLEHDVNPYDENDLLTWVWTHNKFRGDCVSFLVGGHKGTDGEEVVVLCLKLQ